MPRAENMLLSLKAIETFLTPHGLIPRGAIHLDASEARALNANTLVLIGHAGSSIWPHFLEWQKSQPAPLQNPLDTWSEKVITEVATSLNARAIFPSQKPYQPFQQWAMRAEGLKPSPLGILIHPTYGLWHAYRGAIVFADEILIQSDEKLSHPCDLCIGKPCLSTCPVGAFSAAGYDVETCRNYLASKAGESCMSQGCKARLACPVGAEFRYGDEQMRFHMNAFAK